MTYVDPPAAALQAAVSGIQTTIAGMAAIAESDAPALAGLRAQVRAAIPLAVQVVNYYDAALRSAGDPANFAGGTAPGTMAANVLLLLETSAALQAGFDTANRLSRLATNLKEIAAPSGALADIDHVFGNDIGVSASGDIGTVSGWKLTVQRVIRRLCTPATKAAAPVTNLAVPAGEDLFRVAAAQYGDAAGWALIAAANGLADPVIQQDQVLTIPAYAAARVNDGILPVPG